MMPAKTAGASAKHDYEKLMDPSTPVPSAPVYAARLNGLLKTLANAEGAVAECVKTRTELVGALEKLLDTNKAALAADEKLLEEFTSRKATIDSKKQDVEMAIMRGLANDIEQPQGNGARASPQPEDDRPEVEALTPPAMDEKADLDDEELPAAPESTMVPEQPALQQSTAPGNETSGITVSHLLVSTNGSNKRRRLDSGDDFPDLGNDDGIDADVAEMLREDSAGS